MIVNIRVNSAECIHRNVDSVYTNHRLVFNFDGKCSEFVSRQLYREIIL